MEHIETLDGISPQGGNDFFYTSKRLDGEDVASVEGSPHIFDTWRDPDSSDWKVVLQGHEFLAQASGDGQVPPG